MVGWKGFGLTEEGSSGRISQFKVNSYNEERKTERKKEKRKAGKVHGRIKEKANNGPKMKIIARR